VRGGLSGKNGEGTVSGAGRQGDGSAPIKFTEGGTVSGAPNGLMVSAGGGELTCAFE
jgi:hypothetical protein